jgi:acetyl/propionyl-CoA carboxylase alpha subunit
VFYDAMIAKLIAWGESRDQAIVRLRRALQEYRIAGVRTSIPFFQWLLGQPEFQTASIHTTYLDDLLQQRAGAPFGTPEVSLEEVAMIAAALYHSGQRSSTVAETSSAWKGRAKVEGLRE